MIGKIIHRPLFQWSLIQWSSKDRALAYRQAGVASCYRDEFDKGIQPV
jgi:hypothetical protein